MNRAKQKEKARTLLSLHTNGRMLILPNILGSSGAAPLPVLQELGINRVSFGPYVFRSCLKKFVDIVDALHELRGYECFGENTMSRADTNAYLRHQHE